MIPSQSSRGAASETAARRSLPVTLPALGIGKRKIGLVLAAVVFLGLFLLPVLSPLSPEVEKWQARQPVSWMGLLNPAPLSAGHRSFGMQCTACHQEAFQPVADAACTACHKRQLRHLATDNSHASEFGPMRCVDCHAAHEGKARAVGHGVTQCVACHRNLGVKLAEVRDFGDSHPAFHLAVPQGREVVRVPDDDKDMPPERSGLKFSHKAHLVKDGVSTPLGNTVLTCRDCHRLEESGLHFAPMEMERTCQQSRCHKQRFAEPLSGTIPHGSVGEIASQLRGIHANRLGKTSARNYAAATLFQRTGKALQCVLCHDIAADDSELGWKVAPVRSHRDWHAKADFNHAKHGTVDCTECHDKANSESSSDISIPAIAKCRECHAGTAAVGRKVRTPCEDCHRFHIPAENRGAHPRRLWLGNTG